MSDDGEWASTPDRVDEEVERPRARQLSAKQYADWLATLMTIVAGAAAIAGVWVWFQEAEDRNRAIAIAEEERTARAEERESRRKADQINRFATIAQAHETIAQESADGTFSLDRPIVKWAVRLLMDEAIPIFVTADSVSMAGLDLRCATVVIDAKEVLFNAATIQNSRVSVEAAALDLDGVAIYDTELTFVVGDDERKPFAVVSESVINRTGFSNDAWSFHGVSDQNNLMASFSISDSVVLESWVRQEEDISFRIGSDAALTAPGNACAVLQGPHPVHQCTAGSDFEMQRGPTSWNYPVEVASLDCEPPSRFDEYDLTD